MFFALWLLACSEEPDEQPCREDFERAPDGHCYPPVDAREDLDFKDAFDELPDCEPGSTDGRLDLLDGCASGICIGMTVDQSISATDRWPVCRTTSFSATTLYCTWNLGIEALFADLDEDGWPDPGAGTTRLRVYGGYSGGTEEGLGVPVRPSCFIDALGYPDRTVLRDVGGQQLIYEMAWDRYGLVAYDLGTDDGSGRPNGVLDNLYLYGAP